MKYFFSFLTSSMEMYCNGAGDNWYLFQISIKKVKTMLAKKIEQDVQKSYIENR